MGESKRKKQSSIAKLIHVGATPMTLRFNFTGLSALEDMFDMSVSEIGQRFNTPGYSARLRDVHKILFAGTRFDQPTLTYDQLEAILNAAIEEGKTLQEVMTEAFAVLSAGQPEPHEEDEAAPGETLAG